MIVGCGDDKHPKLIDARVDSVNTSCAACNPATDTKI